MRNKKPELKCSLVLRLILCIFFILCECDEENAFGKDHDFGWKKSTLFPMLKKFVDQKLTKH